MPISFLLKMIPMDQLFLWNYLSCLMSLPVLSLLANPTGSLIIMSSCFNFLLLCGNQSSGKSSVLESIVGRDFLPRGSGNFSSVIEFVLEFIFFLL